MKRMKTTTTSGKRGNWSEILPAHMILDMSLVPEPRAPLWGSQCLWQQLASILDMYPLPHPFIISAISTRNDIIIQAYTGLPCSNHC